MSIFSKLGDFFLPDAETSAKRRMDVFGTESKAVVGTVIVAGAATAIAAPAIIASGGGSRAVLSNVASKIGGLSVGSKLALAVATPVAIGAITSNPKIVTRTAGGVANFESNLYELGKNPSIEQAKETFQENPIIAGAVVGGIALVTGKTIATVGSTISNTLAIKENTRTSRSNLPGAGASFPQEPTTQSSNEMIPLNSAPGSPSPVPLTPQTQVIGREVSTIKRKTAKRKPQKTGGNIRVSVLNQNNYIDDVQYNRSWSRYHRD